MPLLVVEFPAIGGRPNGANYERKTSGNQEI
jgi:hypothetical protein